MPKKIKWTAPPRILTRYILGLDTLKMSKRPAQPSGLKSIPSKAYRPTAKSWEQVDLVDEPMMEKTNSHLLGLSTFRSYDPKMPEYVARLSTTVNPTILSLLEVLDCRLKAMEQRLLTLEDAAASLIAVKGQVGWCYAQCKKYEAIDNGLTRK